MKMFTQFFDAMFGRGAHAVTVSALDGVLRPNTKLDSAETLVKGRDVDNLCCVAGRTLYSQGPRLMAIGQDTELAHYDADIAFLVPQSEADAVICGLANGAVVLMTADGTEQRRFDFSDSLNCLTAGVISEHNEVFVANGSSQNTAKDWQRDLLEKNQSGSIWKIDLTTGKAAPVADNLAWPAGLERDGDSLLISEAWAYRLIRLDLGTGQISEALRNLPGYPGRICTAKDGYWLTVFAPRSQLVEFVLHETKFRRRMLAELSPESWIAPCLRTGRSVLEPLQAGGVRQLGVMKAWAPMRSSGLIIRLNRYARPKASFHSRADGHTHGITSCVEDQDGLIFSAKGDGRICKLEPQDLSLLVKETDT